MGRRGRNRKSVASTSRKTRSTSKVRKPIVEKPEKRAGSNDPKWYKIWLAIKSFIQVCLSISSLRFIKESNILFPGYYDPTVWSHDAFYFFFISQASFEMIDLASETTVYLTRGDKSGTLSFDSIVHHFMTAAYYLSATYAIDNPSPEYLGMVMTAICCQVIGPCYSLYRYGHRGQNVLVLMITLQFVFRWPLGIISWIRAMIHFDSTPVVHYLMCCLLSALDYRWSGWMVNKVIRLKESKRKTVEDDAQWLNIPNSTYAQMGQMDGYC